MARIFFLSLHSTVISPIHLSVCPFICLSIHLPINSPIHLPTLLSRYVVGPLCLGKDKVVELSGN